MNLILFFIILIVSFTVVRIGAIAFELTGLEWSLAKFQALSCFTGTGFTTKESELITSNMQRRRIASTLIVLGHAGLVTLIATFANSLRTDIIIPRLRIPFLHSIIPSNLSPWINLTIIATVVYLIYKIFTNTSLSRILTHAIRSHIIKKEIIKAVTFEELVIATGGFGVSKIEICKNSPILDKSLLDSDLKKFGILVLAVERGEEIIPNPSADTKFFLGDRLICFGKLEDIRKEFCGSPSSI
ncbi:MAG: TrkA C-terminal domain-containing protein [Candidatus Omnitrophota bacterium]